MTLTETAGFLARVRETPDDDGPRLIFADWLDGVGQRERGEFIRVQVALARLADTDPRRPDLLRDLLHQAERVRRCTAARHQSLVISRALRGRGQAGRVERDRRTIDRQRVSTTAHAVEYISGGHCEVERAACGRRARQRASW